MTLHHVRFGEGKPLVLVLVHGLGSSWQTWQSVLPALSAEREVVALDLPGFGASPALTGPVTIATLADAVTGFVNEQGLGSADLVGSSMGARLVLELARRGVGGTCVALDPGGFWSQGEVRVFNASIRASITLIRALRPVLGQLTGNLVGRSALFAQLSPRPWAIPAGLALQELRDWSTAPSFDAALDALAQGPRQQGAPAGSTPGPVVIGWGRQDRVTLPRQSARALAAYPGSRLHWFDSCGHFPHWDQPAATTRMVLDATA